MEVVETISAGKIVAFNVLMCFVGQLSLSSLYTRAIFLSFYHLP